MTSGSKLQVRAVICEESGAAALRVLEQVKARDGKVALVLADMLMSDYLDRELEATASVTVRTTPRPSTATAAAGSPA